MNMVLTLVVKPGATMILNKAHQTCKAIIVAGQNSNPPKSNIQTDQTKIQTNRLAKDQALDIFFSLSDPEPLMQKFETALRPLPVDWAYQNLMTRKKRLFLADMDSTIISVECIDELADYLGVKKEVAKITELAMQGALDFESSLVKRVALLRGLKTETLKQCFAERVRLSKGAKTLLNTLVSQSIRTILVSGGFTFFTDRIKSLLGFDKTVANILEIKDEALTGLVVPPICGPSTKLATLESERKAMGVPYSSIIAVGDGANDIAMLDAAGFGVAYKAKPKTVMASDASIHHTDLSSILYFMGIKKSEFK